MSQRPLTDLSVSFLEKLDAIEQWDRPSSTSAQDLREFRRRHGVGPKPVVRIVVSPAYYELFLELERTVRFAVAHGINVDGQAPLP